MSEPPNIAADPYDLPGESGSSTAVLCVHGLTASPAEVRPVAEVLAQHGLRARGLALPGHNESPEDLARVRYGEWLSATRDELAKLRTEHEKVCLVGVSLGGLLALKLATEVHVDALAVVGVPLRLPRMISLLVPSLKHVFPFAPKKTGPSIRDPEARARHICYPVMPLASVHELIRLQRVVRPLLPRITTPILVAHGEHDRTAHPKNADELVARVGSRDKELLLLEDSAHIVPQDLDGPRLSACVAEFFLSRC